MKLHRFSEVAVKYRDYTIDNFSDAAEVQTAVKLNAAAVSFPKNVLPVKLYGYKGNVYFYCSDGRIYRLSDGKIKTFSKTVFTEEPDLIEITENGKVGVGFASCGRAVLSDKNSSFITLFGGEGYVNLDGALFSFSGDKVFFGKRYDGEKDFTLAENEGYISVKGEVIKLIPVGKKLYVLKRNGLDAVAPTDSDNFYSLSEVLTEPFVADNFSVAAFTDGFAFTGGGYLFVFSDNRLKKIKVALKDVKYSVSDEAFLADAKYCLPIVVSGKGYLFVYDFLSEKSFLTPSGDLMFSDGLFFDSAESTVGKISFGYDKAEFSAAFGYNDFDTTKVKRIYSVSASCKKKFSLEIRSEKDVTAIAFDEGYSVKEVKIFGKAFSFAVRGEEKPAFVKVYYTV